jgi:nucleoid-associated protein YgaU
MPLIQLQKAMIREKEGLTHVSCAFNPKQFTISTSAEWKTAQTRSSTTSPPAQFTGTKPKTLTMELLFDSNWLDYFTRGGQVQEDVDQLMSWTQPTPSSVSNNAANPPILVFTWGLESYFDCYLKSVSATFTEFNPLGSPTRATANVTFESIPSDPGPTNPSSGGPAGRRTHLVGAGDTLHSIAQREYGRAALWRGLAVANDIDDPLRVAIGTTVMIPPRVDAEQLS